MAGDGIALDNLPRLVGILQIQHFMMFQHEDFLSHGGTPKSANLDPFMTPVVLMGFGDPPIFPPFKNPQYVFQCFRHSMPNHGSLGSSGCNVGTGSTGPRRPPKWRPRSSDLSIGTTGARASCVGGQDLPGSHPLGCPGVLRPDPAGLAAVAALVVFGHWRHRLLRIAAVAVRPMAGAVHGARGATAGRMGAHTT